LTLAAGYIIFCRFNGVVVKINESCSAQKKRGHKSIGGTMENLYCTIFIVDVSQNPEEVETVTSRIVQLIEDHGGVIKRNERWGKRRLAYPIRKKTSGFYVEIEFTAQSRLNIPHIIESEYRINDRVMRFLTYVVTREELMQRELNATRAQYQDEEASEMDTDANESIVNDEKRGEEDKKRKRKETVKESVTETEASEAEAAEEEASAEENIDEEEIETEKTEN